MLRRPAPVWSATGERSRPDVHLSESAHGPVGHAQLRSWVQRDRGEGLSDARISVRRAGRPGWVLGNALLVCDGDHFKSTQRCGRQGDSRSAARRQAGNARGGQAPNTGGSDRKRCATVTSGRFSGRGRNGHGHVYPPQVQLAQDHELRPGGTCQPEGQDQAHEDGQEDDRDQQGEGGGSCGRRTDRGP
uniref:(northern house mosquito) hypothetical protein n=1 Tax=Culex pipiens TaxID=7175 RepID=A0A8D8C0K9_CULPI